MVHDGQHAVMLCDDKFQKCQFSCQETSYILRTNLDNVAIMINRINCLIILPRAEQWFCANESDGSKLFSILALLCLVMPLYWSHAGIMINIIKTNITKKLSTCFSYPSRQYIDFLHNFQHKPTQGRCRR